MTTALYTVFHLNLAFSSIEEHQHSEVIQKCYWPLLQIAQDIPIGIEMTAYTLEGIHAVAPEWVTEFKALLALGKCELIASGDSQIIGPLIPAEVNRANLILGQDYYQKMLGIKPAIAYINEQAVSAGLLDIYLDAGFEAVVVEWDNPFSHNPDWQPEFLERPQSLISASGRCIKVIWNHAIAFQKFQRYVHGELTEEDYLQYLLKVLKQGTMAFPVYGSDAEIFDFRPGRYQTEASQISGEWQRIKQLFNSIKKIPEYRWEYPSKLLSLWQPSAPLRLTNAQHPVSVKKQAKYNLCRWGLSGRNDLLLNTQCFQRLAKLKSVSSDKEWRDLCRLWASDLRTHLTQNRYDALKLRCVASQRPHFTPWQPAKDILIRYDEARRRLHIQTPKIHLSLNGNRGLAIDSLAFASQAFESVIGTLSHGHFDHISYGADFYTNHLLLERFRDRDRVTDLNRVEYQLSEQDGCLVIYCHQSLKIGGITKWFKLDGEKLHTGIYFESCQRPEASVRLGFMTLLDCEQRAWYQTRLGGDQDEFFQITEDMDQGEAVSSIVSSASALGATNGAISLGSQSSGITISWNPEDCAALPMISSKKINNQYLNRLWFSLAEADETLKSGGHLLNFALCITPTMRPCHV
ncbi:glycoside hydrolase [Shewanella baltica]|uniref:glycoside hydrolase n=2 Tax=Shewanella baltica TaxID=62322 RepID=UPI00217DEF92|nr:glycoside hydrolase [Shewanella baltica]MCS6126441.1 glycoside hydrolase [Shewanella baltica]MCS6137762.1 glycoside hydrolase [Shewanella baltica]MCS6144721.1 glycoside hydrolase [Shewanella baltica]MCS6169249.1 glycoside hydrolase [Shewanella baltica]MCS6186457.1 glycoside hydrolase [Shewanella baltica]